MSQSAGCFVDRPEGSFESELLKFVSECGGGRVADEDNVNVLVPGPVGGRGHGADLSLRRVQRALNSLWERTRITVVKCDEVLEEARHTLLEAQARHLVPDDTGDAVRHVRDCAGVQASVHPGLICFCRDLPPEQQQQPRLWF